MRPTSSRSLCLPPARTHFWTDAARGYGGASSPTKYGLNGTMPATVNSTVGSCGIRLADGTSVWPRADEEVEEGVAELVGGHRGGIGTSQGTGRTSARRGPVIERRRRAASARGPRSSASRSAARRCGPRPTAACTSREIPVTVDACPRAARAPSGVYRRAAAFDLARRVPPTSPTPGAVPDASARSTRFGHHELDSSRRSRRTARRVAAGEARTARFVPVPRARTFTTGLVNVRSTRSATRCRSGRRRSPRRVSERVDAVDLVLGVPHRDRAARRAARCSAAWSARTCAGRSAQRHDDRARARPGARRASRRAAPRPSRPASRPRSSASPVDRAPRSGRRPGRRSTSAPRPVGR